MSDRSVIAIYVDREGGYRDQSTGQWQLEPLPPTRRPARLAEVGPVLDDEGVTVAARPWGLWVAARQPVSLLREGDDEPSCRGRRARVPFGAVARVGSIAIAPLDRYQLEAARLGNRSVFVIPKAEPARRRPRLSPPRTPALAAFGALFALVLFGALSMVQVLTVHHHRYCELPRVEGVVKSPP